MPTIMPDITHFPCPSPERIAQIAEWLPERPTGIGPRATEREVWQRFASSPKTREIIAEAETYVAAPRPELPDELYLEFLRNGNRGNYEDVWFQRIRRLVIFAMAELLEFRGRFLTALQEELLAICETKSWVLSAHDPKLLNFHDEAPYADLSCSGLCREVAIIDWWFGELLGDALRRRLRQEVRRRAFNAYQHVIRTGEITDYQWWTAEPSNWNAVCHDGLIPCALILLDSRQERAEALAAAEVAMPIYAESFTPDGYCSEGIGYWNYGFGHFLNLAETVLLATHGKINFLDNIRIRHAAEYARDIQIEPGCSPAFADSEIATLASVNALAIIQRHFPDAVLTPIPLLQDPVPDPQTFIIRAIGDVATPLAPPSAPVLPMRSYFPDAGVYVGRSGGRFGIACKTGHNDELHNHNDIGSFSLAFAGHQYFLDPGKEIYTYRTFSERRYEGQMLNSFGHQVPVVEGTLQPPGKDIFGVFTKTQFTPDLDVLIADLTTAYPDAKHLVSLKRTFAFDRVKQSLTVKDEVEFDSPQSFETALVSFDDIDISGTTVIASHGQGRMVASITASGGEISLALGEIDNPGAVNPKRVALAFRKPVRNASITVEFNVLKG